jgi:hypothetical protein
VANDKEDGLAKSTTARPLSGSAAVTLSRVIDSDLLPQAALNYGCAAAKTYFEQRFAADLRVVAGAIPEADLLYPNQHQARSYPRHHAGPHVREGGRAACARLVRVCLIAQPLELHFASLSAVNGASLVP